MVAADQRHAPVRRRVVHDHAGAPHAAEPRQTGAQVIAGIVVDDDHVHRCQLYIAFDYNADTCKRNIPVSEACMQELYDNLWTEGIQQGKADFGDLAMSLRFLDLVGLPQPADTVLEIGCGTGALCAALHARGCRDLIGIDIAQSAIEYARSIHPYLDLRCMDAKQLDFPDASFDVCLSFDVVEHLPSVQRHFNDVFRILKPGGHYLFQTPNLFSNAVFSTITYRGLSWRKIHCSLQTHRSLRRHVRDAGFAALEFARVPLADAHKARILPPVVRDIFLNVPWHALPLALQTNYYVVAQKAGAHTWASETANAA
jgi:2-polyprenyl-3-methyl-5-hydroxy-6-metoxy-1,4-benzoquinol methylase